MLRLVERKFSFTSVLSLTFAIKVQKCGRFLPRKGGHAHGAICIAIALADQFGFDSHC